jgi:RNA polymerase sigma-70 factor (ECF subfamily)
MSDNNLDQHLSHISTMWTMLYQAHRGSADEAAAARQVLMQRYCGAVYRYLLGAVRNADAAEDLTQEFALRFIQGRFQQADRSQGRFRNYVKTALFHLVDDYQRGQGKAKQVVPLAGDEALPGRNDAETDEQAFRESWRQELLSRAWKSLEQEQSQTGQPFYDVLRFRVDHPDLTSALMAEQLGPRLGKPLTPAGVRQLLHRARERFAELLLEETRLSLEDAGRDQLEEELAELNLLKYCQDLLPRRK